jgi:hypothetical protein
MHSDYPESSYQASGGNRQMHRNGRKAARPPTQRNRLAVIAMARSDRPSLCET